MKIFMSERFNLTLTDAEYNKLTIICDAMNISKNEYINRILEEKIGQKFETHDEKVMKLIVKTGVENYLAIMNTLFDKLTDIKKHLIRMEKIQCDRLALDPKYIRTIYRYVEHNNDQYFYGKDPERPFWKVLKQYGYNPFEEEEIEDEEDEYEDADY